MSSSPHLRSEQLALLLHQSELSSSPCLKAVFRPPFIPSSLLSLPIALLRHRFASHHHCFTSLSLRVAILSLRYHSLVPFVGSLVPLLSSLCPIASLGPCLVFRVPSLLPQVLLSTSCLPWPSLTCLEPSLEVS